MEVEKEKKAEIIVRFPGERSHSSNAPYHFRNSVDPRLGRVQRLIKSGFFPDVYNLDDEKDRGIELFPPEDNKKKIKKRKHKDGKKPIRKTVVITMTRTVVDPNSESFKSSTPREEFDREELNRLLAKDPLTPRERLRKDFDDMIKNEKQIYRDRDIGCALAAVQFYNQKNGTDYEVVETLGSYSAVYNGILYHCNFRAQSKSESRPSPKLFFAELLNELDAESVKLCAILDNPGRYNRFPRGCKLCPDQLLHPVNFVIWHPVECNR